MCTPMQPSSSAGGGASSHTITLTVPADLAPLSLPFVIHLSEAERGCSSSSKGSYVTPLHGRHFTALAGMLAGSSSPLGPSLCPQQPSAAAAGGATGSSSSSKAAGGKRSSSSSCQAAAGGSTSAPAASATPAAAAAVNFAVRCRGAERVALLLLKPPQQSGQQWVAVEMALDPVLHHTGDVWHAALPALPGLRGLCYGWRVDGDVSWERGFRLQPGGWAGGWVGEWQHRVAGGYPQAWCPGAWCCMAG